VPDSSSRTAVIELVKARGYLRLPEPVQLASGDLSQDFVDVKKALAHGADLQTACAAMVEALRDAGIDYDAVGGMTMGADQFSHVIAVLARCRWFTVRKAVKGRGTNRRIEGAQVGGGDRVVLVDDVVTKATSIRDAFDVISQTGATVVAAMTLVDRGDAAQPWFEAQAVPYLALVTYRDLGIEPVGGGLVNA
jgi:orotate phosphoribosyltransferase